MKISPNLSVLFVAAAATLPDGTEGCSRVLQNKFDTIVAGRSMDWGFSFEDVLFLNPPGQEMDGGAGDLSVKWTSKYVSLPLCVEYWSTPSRMSVVLITL